MQDTLIFPTSIEQVGTGELVHDTFPSAKWFNVPVLDEIREERVYVSDLEIDVAPSAFFEWAYQTPAGQGPIIFYCLHLSTELLLAPPEWMLGIIARIATYPKQLPAGL